MSWATSYLTKEAEGMVVTLLRTLLARPRLGSPSVGCSRSRLEDLRLRRPNQALSRRARWWRWSWAGWTRGITSEGVRVRSARCISPKQSARAVTSKRTCHVGLADEKSAAHSGLAHLMRTSDRRIDIDSLAFCDERNWGRFRRMYRHVSRFCKLRRASPRRPQARREQAKQRMITILP